MIFNNEDVGKRVSFQIYGSAIIGGDYANAELLAVLGASAASEYNPKARHDAIYSTLPDPKPQSHSEYVYYLLLLANGRRTIAGDAWIVPDTVIRGSANKIFLEIDGANAGDIGKIKTLLTKEGYQITKASIATASE